MGMIHEFKNRVLNLLLILFSFLLIDKSLEASSDSDPSVSEMRGHIERFELDLGNLKRFYKIRYAHKTIDRELQHLVSYEKLLGEIDFEGLNQAGRIDYLLMRTHLDSAKKDLEIRRDQLKEADELAPWLPKLRTLVQNRQRVEPVNAGSLAAELHQIHQEIETTLASWKESERVTNAISANRIAGIIQETDRHIAEWFRFYDGYNPVFSWWVKKPFEKLRGSISDASSWLREEIAGYEKGKDAPLIGDPIGRKALISALERNWITYSPEELIRIAEIEMEWCLDKRKKAAQALGFKDDWKSAQNKVKGLHVSPGEQPQLIKELAREAEDFLTERDLLTIPEIARETWRMEMMSEARQKVSPYFTGGEVISVSYPTHNMDHDHKMMSMRGNNRHFSKATVHHELIPGHHLQLFMAERYNAHRKLFRTPFLVEGWALYWEMLLWDLGFADSPEDEIGMLFWRSHRCARIIFSLNFHLGNWSPEQCIDYLVENVGHERRNATAEVRRSIQAGYEPLYQAAYMLGGLQLKELGRTMTQEKEWTLKQFHDAILIENSIPIEFIRASLTKAPLTRETQSTWKFYPALHEKQTVENKNSSDSIENPRAYRIQLKPNWFDGGNKMWYRIDTGRNEFEFVLVDAVKGKRTPAFDHNTVASELSKILNTKINPKQLPIHTLEFSNDGKTIKIIGNKGSWVLNRSDNKLEEIGGDKKLEEVVKYDSIIPSGDNGEETELTFINELKIPIKIYWVDRDRNEVFYHDIAPGKSISQHTFGNHVWAVKDQKGTLLGVFTSPNQPSSAYVNDSKPRKRETRDNRRRRGGNRAPQHQGIVSPNGEWVAYTKDHNLHVKSLVNGANIQLTDYGNDDHSFQQNGQREKFMGMQYSFKGHPDYLPKASWSPDSKYLVAMQVTKVPEHLVHIVQSSPKDQKQPKLHTITYFKPGDPIPEETPHLFQIKTGKEIPVNKELFSTPWRLGRIDWHPDSSEFVFSYNQRGHQVMRMIGVQSKTGKARSIVNEECETFFDYAYKQYWRWLKDSNEAIWMSERDGWNHLYLYDVAKGEVKNQITSGEFVVRRVLDVDVKNRTIHFTAGGYSDGEDPYHVHYYKINFDGSELTKLTHGDGTHSIEYSPDKRFLVDTYSRVDMAPVRTLRNAQNGELICELERGNMDEFEHSKRSLPHRFAAPGRDGKTMIYGIIHFPKDFNPSKKYPVIENIYAGPHSAHVPKSYRNNFRQSRLTDLGFIVVQIDGMGTSQRSKAFHDVCWKNIVDAGFPDRIAWIKAASQKYPSMDLKRVGIYGGSAGGQNALGALLTHGDFYKSAVADCGCHDNTMDKIWWNELWMSYPIEEHYKEQSNVTLAKNLKGNLLLLLGEIDKNVDPASTMQVVDALIQANKEFEMLVMPNVGHGAAGTRYGWNKLTSFFEKTLK